jgi:hypothetical protein
MYWDRRQRPRGGLTRDNHLRREFDDANPNFGWSGFIFAAMLLVALVFVVFGHPADDTSSGVVSRFTIESPTPKTPANQ